MIVKFLFNGAPRKVVKHRQNVDQKVFAGCLMNVSQSYGDTKRYEGAKVDNQNQAGTRITGTG